MPEMTFAMRAGRVAVASAVNSDAIRVRVNTMNA
jgi:hypothetical protein